MRIIAATASFLLLSACELATTSPPAGDTAAPTEPGGSLPADGEAPRAALDADLLREATLVRGALETERSPFAAPPADAYPLLELTGLVTSSLEAEGSPLEVGVLWLNLLDDNTTVLVEAARVDAIGTSLPASFDVSLLAPPSAAMRGATLTSWSEGGATERPVDASRVAFGYVVVAPEGTLATLPTSTTLGDFISGSDASAGPLLSSFTLVSPYAVRYVEGAEAEGVVLRDIDGVPYALADFTLIDLGAWARGIDNAICRDRFLGEGWATPEVRGCIEANAERIAAGEAAAAACAAACPEAAEGEFDRCTWDCTTLGDTSGNVGNECLYAWAGEQAEATDARCGAQPDLAESDFRSARRLEAGEAITLTLGEGDIRSALTAGGFTFLY
jgi:hypothetical protein